MKPIRKKLYGWGRWNGVDSEVIYPRSLSEIKSNFDSTNLPLIARGLGRSYGDASLTEGLTMDMTELHHFIAFDREHGKIKVQAGISLQQILDVIVPEGWFLPVTPGTQYCTIGGCIASDVHGKNHHLHGSFSNFVHQFEILTRDGEVMHCSANENPELFLATCGGMGLTGIILTVELTLLPIETAYITERRKRVRSWESLMDELKENSPEEPYAVAWVDASTPKGRGELWLGKHTPKRDLPKWESPFRHVYIEKSKTVPDWIHKSIVNKTTISLFNGVKYHTTTSRFRSSVVPYHSFFYPLDRWLEWNRLYGSNGFVQYQYVVPLDTPASFHRQVIQTCIDHRQIPSLTVFKKLGKCHQDKQTVDESGYLPLLPTISFPKEGWTLALDFPMKEGLLPLLDKLDSLVIDRKGAVYLSKDARLSPQAFRLMYPQYSLWRAVCKKYNEESRFQSILTRRLELC